MSEPCGVATTPRAQCRKVGVAALAEGQWGVVSRGQLKRAGLGGTTISRWLRDGRLHALHPGVYAVGHRALPVEGRLTAALLFAGPGAMLSHATAGWWSGLWGTEPKRIHVSVAADRRSSREVVVHGRRHLEPVERAGLPVTSVPQTLVDLHAVESVARRGVPGSAALRSALAQHRPELARTRSVLEERFVALCEAEGVPPPRVNASICGLTVDALWADRAVIVELDGHAAHATPSAAERDRRRELRLRAAGYQVVRYTWQQVTQEPGVVSADLQAVLSEECTGARAAAGGG